VQKPENRISSTSVRGGIAPANREPLLVVTPEELSPQGHGWAVGAASQKQEPNWRDLAMLLLTFPELQESGKVP